MTNRVQPLASLGLGLLLSLASAVHAADYYWMGTGTWSTLNNWADTPAGLGGAHAAPPGSSDSVFFLGRGSSSVIETDYTVGALVISNVATAVTFTNTAPATLTIVQDFYLGTGCTLTVTRSSTNGNGTGRAIAVGGSATIQGAINGNYKGFDYQSGPGAGYYNLRGGSHGGRGGKSSYAPYGSLTQPTALGSGGGNNTATFGGGAVKLAVTRTLTVDGTISVRGADDHDAASGGSIWLVASNFAGTGKLDASGGNCSASTQDHPGGGGGRIALEYTNSTFSGTITCAGGLGGNDGSTKLWLHAQPGTLWEPGRLPSSGDVTITGGSYQYWLPAGSTQNWGTLTVASLDQSGMLFLHNGTINIRDLVISNATLRVDIGDTGNTLAPAMAVDALSLTGSLAVVASSAAAANAGYLYLPSRGTYALAGAFACGSNTAVFVLGDTNAINPASGGTAGNPHGAGVILQCATAVIDGSINGDYQGFAAGGGPGAGLYNNYGASHGGLGSRGASASMKPPYGSLMEPTALGSGGGADGSGTYRGGGAVKIAASNSIVHNGSILVRGQADHDGCSGGSIWLRTTTLSGTGSLYADGGNCNVWPSQYHGAGGGGRISIQATNSTFAGFVSAAAGSGAYYAQPGTLWQPGRFTLPGDVTLTSGYQYLFDPGSTQVFHTLTLANPSQGGGACFLNGHIVIGDLLVSNAVLRFDVRTNGTTGLFNLDSLTVTGSITVAAANTNWDGVGVLYLPAEGTYALAGDLVCRSNTVIYALGNTNSVNASSGGTPSVPHGVGPSVRAANAFIDGAVNSDSLGFPANKGPAAGSYNNYGASHGGRGGKPGAKAPYGALSRPTALGSGGDASSGGGAIRIETTNTLVMNGVMVARGSAAHDAASGGSIWLRALALTGVGSLRVDGGDSSSAPSHPGGGGGRIAMESATVGFTGTLSAKGGAGGTPASATGTWFNCQIPLDDRGITVRSDYSVSGHANGLKITRTIVKWTASRMEWDETSTEWATGNLLDNTGTYTVQGLAPNRIYKAFDNGIWHANLLVDEFGTATPFAIVLTGGAHTVMVQAPQGSVFTIR